MNTYHNWDLKVDEHNILWLGIDRAGSSVNTINDDVLNELNDILTDISQTSYTGLIIYSLKEKGFIAGADVKAFSQFKTSDEYAAFLKKGQTVFARLESLTIPTLALIRGFCMGGGLELALACRYRVAASDTDTRLGLPEVLLGIHPGWGGTVRLVRLIGGFQALTRIILPGASVSAKEAKRLGIVDDAVPDRQLQSAACYFILHQPTPHQLTLMQKVASYSIVRSIIAPFIHFQLAKRVKKQHYPAPYHALKLWEEEGAYGERAYIKEIESVLELIGDNNTARELTRLFLLREKMKGLAKNKDFKASHVHVIGAGVMGGDIAAWCALKGLRVTLQDESIEKIAQAIQRANILFKKSLKLPRLIEEANDRLIPDPTGIGLARADVIIEAVFENLEVKQSVIKQVELVAKKEAIITTNTSSIPLDEISIVMKKPERLVGIHYFNPVAKMELVEVVVSDLTETDVCDKACAFVNQISRLPLPVKSSPGFLVNRILMPYLMECIILLQEGYTCEAIDQSAKDFGMFMGPVELVDTVGLDVCLAVAENLSHYFGGSVPEILRTKVKEGKLGRKSGEGFYTYKGLKPIRNKKNNGKATKEIAQRLIFRIINESGACLREQVVNDSDLLDAAMVFATGFAPFRGGPIQYAKSLGDRELHALSNTLESQYGQRFKLDPYFNELIKVSTKGSKKKEAVLE